jgi:hypothetical protein
MKNMFVLQIFCIEPHDFSSQLKDMKNAAFFLLL